MVTTRDTRWKGLRVLIVSCVLLTMLPGCGWIGWVYRPVSWNKDKVMIGMTEEEVRKVMGDPDSSYGSSYEKGRGLLYTQRCRIGSDSEEVGGRGYCEGDILRDFAEKFLRQGLILTLGWWIPANSKDFFVDFDERGRVVNTSWSYTEGYKSR